MKYQLLIAATLLICSSGCSQEPVISAGAPVKIQKSASYLSSQPNYQIDFSASACLFEIRVNDVVVLKMNIQGQTATNLPINNTILQSGQQQISVKVSPLTGKSTLDHNAEFRYHIQVIDGLKGMSSIQQLPGGYTFPAIGASPPSVLSHSETFTADVPFTTPSYQNGTDLRSVKDLKERVRKAYQQVADLIDKGDYETLKKLVANRESIVAVNTYLSPKASAARMNGLIDDFKNGFKIEPIPDNAVVTLEANGKLAALKRPNGDSALFLTNKKTSEEESVDLSLFLPQGATTMEIR